MNPKQRKAFSWTEFQHLLIAWLALGLAFSISTIGSLGLFTMFFMISLLTIGAGFIGHELLHKFVAQRYGCYAEFRMWPMGLILALAFAVLSGGRLIFAAPGAVYITPMLYDITKRENGIISLSGPMANVFIALIFLSFAFYNGLLGEIGSLGFYINALLAAFNLIPLPPMDGYKVFMWNKFVWAALAVPLWAVLFLL
ncbi:MAG: site-2 protease family protein [Nitrososphaerales archaeon]|nr:site-2 protease family protein [Nitrososphaerales archaeon]